MRKIHFIWLVLALCALFSGIVRAETFELADGETVSGEIVSFNESGLILRTPDDKYSDRIPWSRFSQRDLRQLAENQKIQPLVEPFIEETPEERLARSEIKLSPVPRLERPKDMSLLRGMFSSSIGLFTLVLLYGANIYAAYEIAVFRARPVGLVCGVAAVAPVIGPIVFLSLPTRVEQTEEAGTPYDTAVIQPFGAPAQPADGQTPAPADSGALRLSQTESAGPAAALPQTQVFQRGAFTFNRRFFETRFPGFFGVVRREAEKDMVLLIKSARGQHVAERITRISATDVHLHVQKGPASEEVMVPFSEIQEIQLKHKDA